MNLNLTGGDGWSVLEAAKSARSRLPGLLVVLFTLLGWLEVMGAVTLGLGPIR